MHLIRSVVRVVGMGLVMSVGVTGLVHASTCEDAFARALESASAACLPLGENEVCYGHPAIIADTDSADPFDTPGDRIPFDNVSTLSTAPYDASTDEWGVAWVQYTNADGVTVRLLIAGAVTMTRTSDGLALDIADEGGCSGIPGGLVAAGVADSPADIVVNGGTIEISDALVLFVRDDELVSLPLDVLEAAASEADTTAEETLPDPVRDALLEVRSAISFAVQTFESSSDTLIVPRSGVWALESHQVRVVNVCPGILGDGSRQPVSPPQTVEFDFSEGISVETFLEQRTGSVPPAEFDNPVPNIYTAIGDAAGRPVEVTLTVVSETEFIYSVVAYQIDCLLQTINWWEFQGEE